MPKEEPVKLKARLFTNGRSQAVRLPKSLRFDAEEVYLWKEGGRVILEPVPQNAWPAGYWQMVDELRDHLEVNIEPMTPGFQDLSVE